MGSEKTRAWAGAALVAAAGAAAYAGSFAGLFQFDDIPAILDNPTIRWIWPPTIALYPPIGALTVSGRPLLNLSFAVNYALSGYRPWSYHALNLLIHVSCALALLGLLRRSLARIGAARPFLCGLAAALLWVVHPVTTEAVTYVVQRAESLMALLYLLTLYGFVRAMDRAAAGGRPGGWLALSWLACLLGTGVKEVIVSAPAAVYLYDRIFVARSWTGPWRARRGYYLALAATWLPLFGLVAWIGWNRGATSGFHVGIAWWPYWRSQGEALARYVALAFWPHPLVFNYGPSTLPVWAANALFGLAAAAFAATAAGAIRGRPWAFPAACAFMILAPTSVIPGVLQFVAEHRDYLPLAAILALAVPAAAAIAGRFLPGRAGWGCAALAAAALALGFATARRNRLYRSELGLWLDTAVKRPGDPLAQANVGHALLTLNRVADAMPYCLEAVRLDPSKPTAHYNLGLAYEQQEDWVDAAAQFAIAASINPDLFYASFRAGRLLDRLGRPADAERLLRLSLAVEPNYADSHGSLGVALAAEGRLPEAVAEYRRSLALRADQPEVEFNLGVSLARLGRGGGGPGPLPRGGPPRSEIRRGGAQPRDRARAGGPDGRGAGGAAEGGGAPALVAVRAREPRAGPGPVRAPGRGGPGIPGGAAAAPRLRRGALQPGQRAAAARRRRGRARGVRGGAAAAAGFRRGARDARAARPLRAAQLSSSLLTSTKAARTV